jgi:hypothetical protein
MVRDVQARRRFEAQMLTLGPLAGELFEVCCLERFPDAWSATGGLSGGVMRLMAGLRLLADGGWRRPKRMGQARVTVI